MAHNPDTTILITRPTGQAEAYRQEMAARFPNATVLLSPLMEILPLKADLDFTGIHHLIFTSVNAVEAYSKLTPRRDIPALCVGDKTANSATNAGMNAISANGTVNDLGALAQRHTEGNERGFLHIRGQHMAGNLGLKAREVIAYEQHDINMSEAAIQVMSSSALVVVPLFSPRTAALFMQAIAGREIQNVQVVCISDNTANELDPARFAGIRIASEPNAAAVTREIAAVL